MHGFMKVKFVPITLRQYTEHIAAFAKAVVSSHTTRNIKPKYSDRWNPRHSSIMFSAAMLRQGRDVLWLVRQTTHEEPSTLRPQLCSPETPSGQCQRVHCYRRLTRPAFLWHNSEATAGEYGEVFWRGKPSSMVIWRGRKRGVRLNGLLSVASLCDTSMILHT